MMNFKRIVVLVIAAAICLAAGFRAKGVEMKRLAPVLVVEEIEPCLPFWDRLGFEKTTEVPEGDKLGFVILKKGPVEIMYQTRAGLEKDMPILAKDSYRSALFIEVEALDPVIEALKGADIIFPERQTFYGAREIGFREPGGSVVTFAEFTAQN